MKNTALIVVAALVLMGASGCSSTNRIVGHYLTQTGHWYGELGITGNINNVTVQTGSTLTKLSIIGDGNKVDVEDRVTLGKIEIWGERNTVSIPEYLVVRVAAFGVGNQIIRRTPAGEPVLETPDEPFEQLQPTEDFSRAPAPPAESQFPEDFE